MSTLVLIRHGQSQWNLENRFTGWVDIPISEKGRLEARQAGKDIAEINFHIAYTSKLIRAIETLLLATAETKTGKIPLFYHNSKQEQDWQHHTGNPEKELPVIMHTALNERYYGDLQGLNKDDAREKWGKEQVHIWRRSYDIPPPQGESLKDTYERTVPYFVEHILKNLKDGQNVLVVAHGNSLRAIVKYLENISDDAIPSFEIPTGIPRIYEIEPSGKANLTKSS
ncbi:MAG: 2,3-bisphosphoglycerate-dependent phosphoglycerate mutase [bacterium]